MARGFLSGILAGGFVSVLGLGTASLLSEQPAGNTPPEAPQVDAPEVAGADMAEPAEPATPSMSGPGEGDGPSLGPVPDVDVNAAEPSTDSALPMADTAPPAMPEGGIVEGEMAAPDETDANGLALQTDDPVLPSPLAVAPQTPVAEADIVLSTDPAQEPAPVVVQDPEVATPPEPEDFFVTDTDGDTAQEPQDAPVMVDLTDTPPPAPDNPAQESQASDAPDANTQTPATESDDTVTADAGETAPARLQLQGGENSLLTDRDTGVTIRRPTTADEATPEDEIIEAPAVRALAAYAARADNPENLPMMSIVLIDDGSMPAARAALAGLPFAVTIAIDPSLPNAAELSQAYRSEGFELAAIAHLPEGATPTDVEVSFQSVFAELPESIAILDLGDAGFQQNREATEQAMDILAADGRGYVTLSQGLNAASRAAEQSGVPAVVAYRNLDSEDQEARVIRRFVDQAAFRARQEGGVVLVGRMRPDTLSALILWGTANRAGQVAMVPVSAVLTAGE